MSWYCVYSNTENKAKCVVSGRDILDALDNNPNVIRYYIGIGKRAKNFQISIDETNEKNFGEYVITVKYTRHKLNGKKEGDCEMVLWADSMSES